MANAVWTAELTPRPRPREWDRRSVTLDDPENEEIFDYTRGTRTGKEKVCEQMYIELCDRKGGWQWRGRRPSARFGSSGSLDA